MSDIDAAYLGIFPLLDILAVKGEFLWEKAWNHEAMLRDPRMRNSLPTIGEFREECAPIIAQLKECIEDEQLKNWNPDFYRSFSEGLNLLLEARDYSSLTLITEQLDSSLTELWTFRESRERALLGEWGAVFFRILMEQARRSLWDDEGVEQAIAMFYSAGGEDPDVLSDPPELILDESTFSVRIGDRQPCLLKNSKRFRFLQALARSPNRYVNFFELANRMGDDAEDVDALPVTKLRLVRCLSAGGYSDLAQSIKAQTGHYGLFFQ